MATAEQQEFSMADQQHVGRNSVAQVISCLSWLMMNAPRVELDFQTGIFNARRTGVENDYPTDEIQSRLRCFRCRAILD